MELSPETVKMILDEGIQLLYKVVPTLLFAILFYLIGRVVVKKLIRGLELVLEKRQTDLSLSTFLLGLVKALLYVSLVIGVATIVGVPMSSFFAILGAAGLAIGLAMQGSLSNFAGGVLILLFKPFQVGDVIIGMGHKGTVQRIDILYTHLFTFDNKEVVIPNGNLANADVINITSQSARRVDMNVGVAYATDLKKVRTLVLTLLAQDSRIHAEPEPVVLLNNFGDSSLDLVIRAWTDTEIYWDVYHETLEKIKEAFEKEKIEIPFPQRVVYHIKEEGI